MANLAKNVFLLNDESAFSAGAFENIVWEDGALRLAKREGCCAVSGCFTSPEMPAPAFSALIASWNAAAPRGATVEVSVRVCVEGVWTRWMSYGIWSPFVRRASCPVERGEGEAAYLDTDQVRVGAPDGASAFQLRARLCTNAEHVSPALFLLAASVRPVGWVRAAGEPVSHRAVPVPAYSQSIRDPRIANVICSAVTITMLMNRWGEDLLPEETAHASYDYTYGGNGNWSFTAAIAGSCGFECLVAYTDIAGLKNEIWNGFACGVSVHYADTPQNADARSLPLIEGTTGCTDGHLMVVRGFETDEHGVEYVLCNDSYAKDDASAERRYALDQFARAWNGVAYLIHGRKNAREAAPPQRIRGELRRTELPGEYALYLRGERRSIPTDFCERGGVCTGTICYTVQDGHAYATTAHKHFYYTDVSPSGAILLDPAIPAGTRMTVYLIGELGTMVVADLTI